MMQTISIEYPGGLEQAKADALARIDKAAGEARARYITIAPGQAETYQAKAIDAESYLAGNEGPHPWVAADAAAFAITETEAAEAILAQRDAWVRLGALIEQVRLASKQQVKAALTAREAMEAAKAAEVMLEGF
jgi:hypothetical protein